MKKIKWLIGLLCFVCVANAQDGKYDRHWKDNVEKVRIMSYNILNGFHWGKDLDRQARLVEWIKERDPEILALEELCNFNQQKLSELAKQWGHPYSAIVKEGGYPVGITSKKPIVVKNKILENVGHGLLHVVTYDMNILVTHLNPSNASKRRKEAQTILQYAREHELTDFFLMGDLNSQSPFDADFLEGHASELTSVYGGNASPNLLNGAIDYSVISTFLSYPLIDVCRMYIQPENRYTFPTYVLMGVSKQKSKRIKREERLDYILATPSMMDKVVDAFIWHEGAEYLSDHYPIGIDLLIEHEKNKK